MVEKRSKLRLMPSHIMVFVFSYLVLGWSAFYFIDVLNIFGLRDAMVASGMDIPIVWIHLFREAGLTELIQWTALLTTSVVSVTMAFKLRARSSFGPSAFWLILGVAVF